MLLGQDLYVLWKRDPITGDDLMLPEGTPIRDPRRVGESELLGAEWSFEASLDGGKTWRAFPAVARAELDAVINAFARTLARYVPDDKLDDAEAFMREELGLVGLDRGDGEAS